MMYSSYTRKINVEGKLDYNQIQGIGFPRVKLPKNIREFKVINFLKGKKGVPTIIISQFSRNRLFI